MVLFGEWFEWLVTESWGSVCLSLQVDISA